MNGLTKLIYSGVYDTGVDVGWRLIEDPAVMNKSASTVFDCDYGELAPDKDHVGLHLVALGDFEHYGSNRNGDSFPKKACIDYHDTFVKHAHVYRHHRNKDPKKSLGNIVKSAYVGPMGRVELFIHANKEKCADELEKLARDGEIPFSMACRVAFDRCSVCNTTRKSAADDSQCDHVKYSLGKVASDGKVICTHNDEPRFFDISFVGRPADRIAWHLKTASGEFMSSTKMAEEEGIWVPDSVAILSESAMSKLAVVKRLAELEGVFAKLASTQVRTYSDLYTWELRKAACGRLDEATIEELRKYEPADVFLALAKQACILDPESFYKYAMGPDYGTIEQHMDVVFDKIARVFTDIVNAGECQAICNESIFDVNPNVPDLPVALRKLAETIGDTHSLSKSAIDNRVIDTTMEEGEIKIALDSSTKIACNTCVTIDVLAEKYAAYKVAALHSILSQDLDTDAALTVSAAQNFVEG
jgi:hypothetical protein